MEHKSRLGQTGLTSFCLCICSSGRQKLIKNKTQRSSRGSGQPPSLPSPPRPVTTLPGSRAPSVPPKSQASLFFFSFLIIQITTWGEIRAGTGNTGHVLPCSCRSVSLQVVNMPCRTHLGCSSQRPNRLAVTPACHTWGCTHLSI